MFGQENLMTEISKEPAVQLIQTESSHPVGDAARKIVDATGDLAREVKEVVKDKAKDVIHGAGSATKDLGEKAKKFGTKK
jgi:hypothetical protein